MKRTLLIVKPDAVGRRLIGRILSFVEEGGLHIVGIRMVKLSPDEARKFYRMHEGKPFFEKLTTYMSSGRCVAAVVEGDDAVSRLRHICGVTDPSSAAEGTIRAAFGIDITMNSVHASDSPSSADEEIRFFFPDLG